MSRPAETPGWLQQRVDLLAERIGVDPRRRWRDWLTALLFRTRRARQRRDLRNETLETILGGIGWLLGLPLRLFERLIDRVSYGPIGAGLERWSARPAFTGPLTSVLVLIGAALLLALWATTPLSLGQQAGVFVVTWLATLFVRRIPGKLPTLLMIAFSLLATSRYVWWRVSETLPLDGATIEWLLGFGLLLAESYAWTILLLGYIQNAWPLDRPVAKLPDDPSRWPTVDVYIPTYNEPLSVVKTSVLAALSMDWPREKLNVYLLDDGNRDSFRDFAAEAGARYLRRADNRHAKAGNLNHALARTDGELIAIFDCDHVPVRSFLQTTVGWLLRDPKCALVQTPHHFFSADPFERNLATRGEIPNEGNLFYGLVQDGNDLWNATFFCGSCAVIRRTALLEVGGIATETVTEDAHTALKIHRRGWTSAYLRVTQAAGLATESLSAHIGQRIRWARGMAQIFRIDNPLFGRGLKLVQRLCYANAMLHFFYGLPRLVFLTAPLAYLLFELHVIRAESLMLVAFALPHLVQASLVNSRMQGRYRHSFWAEAYESVLAWYIALPTTMALLRPSSGEFNVTVKGGLVEERHFDWQIAAPYLVLIALNTLGLAMAVPRLLYWNAFETGTVVINALWSIANVAMMGTALGVAAEARQVRRAHRVPLSVPATLYLPGGRVVACQTLDYSASGLGLTLPEGLQLASGSHVHVGLVRGDREHAFPARVALSMSGRIGLQFEALSLEAEQRLIECTFGRADAWVDNDRGKPQDQPLSSLRTVLRYGLRGYGEAVSGLVVTWRARRARQRSARI